MFGIDIEERGDDWYVSVAMPGVREEDVVVTAQNGDTICMRAIHKELHGVVGNDPQIDLKAIYYDKTAVLPEKADTDHLEATFFAQFLEVRIPKLRAKAEAGEDG